MGNCNSLSNNTRGSIIDSERDSNRHPSSSSTRINHHPTTSSSISHPQQQTPLGPSPYYYQDDTYDDHHAREQARPTPQVVQPTTLGPRNNNTLAIFDRGNTSGSTSTRSSFVSRIRLSPGSARSNSGRSLRRLVNLAAGPRSRQQQQQDGGGEHSSRQLAVQQGGGVETTDVTTSSTRQNRAITAVVDENDFSYHPSSTTSNSEHQPTWSVSSTDEHVLTTSSNSLNDRLPVVVVDHHNSDNDSITGSSATPNNNPSVEENSSSHSNAAVASASSNNNNNNPYSVSLGFSPLGVSATRRQSSGTPRLIFRRPQRTAVTNSNNNNNTRRSNSGSIRNNSNDNNNTNRSPVRSTFSTTSVGGSSTGRTRTSWQASDSLGDEHYFFTYSAPPASSSRSSSSGTTGGNSSPTTISRSTHSNTSGSTASSLAALSSRHNNRRRRGTTPAQAISRLATAGSSAAGRDEEDPFSTYNARLRRRLRAARESRDAEGEESTTLVSSDRPFSSLIHPESAESDHNSPDQRRRRRRRTFQFGNSLSRRNNGRGSGSDNNNTNNRSGITAEAYGPALFPLRRDQGAGDDSNNNDGDNTPNTNNTTGLPLDLEELYRELRVMEHLFANLFPGAGNLFEAAAQEAAFQASWNAANADPQNSTGPPAASAKAIRQLPTIQVAEIDLIDESNRECCICFEPHNLGDKLTRLPCGHLFHGPCVQEWLHKHCTCPVCRYELETDDAQYEVGRRERMKHRKPRYHRYELERMTIRELRDLMSKCRIALVKGSATEKNDLVDLIVNSGRITVISTAPVPNASDQDTKSNGPGAATASAEASATTAAGAASTPATEPVHYRLSELRRMSIGSLKKIMTDHGVFYDPADVVEKEDMVQIFINSGRCIVVPEQEEDDEEEEEGGSRMRDDGEDDNNNGDEESPLHPMNEDMGAGDQQGDHDMDDGQMIEHEDEEQDAAADENMMSDSTSGAEGFSVPASLELSIVDVTNHDVMTSNDVARQQQQQQQQEERRASDDEHNVGDATGPNTSASATAPTANSNEEDWEMVDDNAASNSNPSNHTPAAATAAATAAESEPGSTIPTNDQDQARHLTGLSISQLKQLAYELNVNVNDCLEKREMIERIADAAMARRAHSGGSATSAQ